jgi:hypothetical protein
VVVVVVDVGEVFEEDGVEAAGVTVEEVTGIVQVVVT